MADRSCPELRFCGRCQSRRDSPITFRLKGSFDRNVIEREPQEEAYEMRNEGSRSSLASRCSCSAIPLPIRYTVRTSGHIRSCDGDSPYHLELALLKAKFNNSTVTYSNYKLAITPAFANLQHPPPRSEKLTQEAYIWSRTSCIPPP
jgi:hypothetical protein